MIQRSRLYLEAVKRHDALFERKKAPTTNTSGINDTSIFLFLKTFLTNFECFLLEWIWKGVFSSHIPQKSIFCSLAHCQLLHFYFKSRKKISKFPKDVTKFLTVFSVSKIKMVLLFIFPSKFLKVQCFRFSDINFLLWIILNNPLFSYDFSGLVLIEKNPNCHKNFWFVFS